MKRRLAAPYWFYFLVFFGYFWLTIFSETQLLPPVSLFSLVVAIILAIVAMGLRNKRRWAFLGGFVVNVLMTIGTIWLFLSFRDSCRELNCIAVIPLFFFMAVVLIITIVTTRTLFVLWRSKRRD